MTARRMVEILSHSSVRLAHGAVVSMTLHDHGHFIYLETILTNIGVLHHMPGGVHGDDGKRGNGKFSSSYDHHLTLDMRRYSTIVSKQGSSTVGHYYAREGDTSRRK